MSVFTLFDHNNLSLNGSFSSMEQTVDALETSPSNPRRSKSLKALSTTSTICMNSGMQFSPNDGSFFISFIMTSMTLEGSAYLSSKRFHMSVTE